MWSTIIIITIISGICQVWMGVKDILVVTKDGRVSERHPELITITTVLSYCTCVFFSIKYAFEELLSTRK